MAAPTSSAAPRPSDISLSQDPAAQPPAQNGAHTDGPVQPSGAFPNSATDSNASSNIDATDSIRQGKQKARAVMEAAGVTARTASNHSSPAQHTAALSNSSNRPVNGVALTRKRSRSGSRIPAQPASDNRDISRPARVNLEIYQQHDELFRGVALKDLGDRNRQLVADLREDKNEIRDGDVARTRHTNPGAVFGYGYAGYGNGVTNERPTQVRYPSQKRRPGGRMARELRIPRKDMASQAEMPEELVPVRLEVEFDRIKLRDTFTWNLNDRTVPPELFAETLVEDFNLPRETFPHIARQVNHEIVEQLQDYYPHLYLEGEATDPYVPYQAHKNDEMRILIKLDITIGQLELVDQFEWDINNSNNDPEVFARQMASDLSLSGEFATAIAHSIREQIQLYTRSLYITGHPFDGRPVEDADLRDGFLPTPIPTVFRPVQAAKEYGPYLYELTEADFEKTELSLMREQRRQKRSVNRRGGPALPDLKDRQKTVRSLVVSSILPGASETVEEARIYRYSRQSGRGRRPGAGRGDEGDESDDFESEDSGPESPAPSLLQGGTARTRGMRGAASAAQVAMRANVMGRSATPEISQQLTPHHHETRTSRRTGLSYDTREESVVDGPPSLMLKLKISREKYRRWNRERKARDKEKELQQQREREQQLAQQAQQAAESSSQQAASSAIPSQNNTPQRNTPQRPDMPPPPTTPGAPPPNPPVLRTGGSERDASSTPQPLNQPAAQPPPPTSNGTWRYTPEGRVDTTNPPSQPVPPPPPHLLSSLAALRSHPSYSTSDFTALMRPQAISTTTNEPIRQENLEAEKDAGTVKYMYVPKIKCNDCPGRLYNFPVENFEVHLRNRAHLANVERRRGG
ncbi:MAG: SWI/SNF chromatin-remodeling complex subunit [Bogoriella megaspora]|nr:MAG: SWI/SNF chromatin-remodeling complex subunit [Bogoriella megaspora]